LELKQVKDQSYSCFKMHSELDDRKEITCTKIAVTARV
jgi:hypothetical protein